jgi:uridine phosphorylase
VDTIAGASSAILKQHLIGPESRIRCNTCEDTCAQGVATVEMEAAALFAVGACRGASVSCILTIALDGSETNPAR